MQGLARLRLPALALLVRHARGLAATADLVARYEPLRKHPTLFLPDQVSTWLHPECKTLLAEISAAATSDDVGWTQAEAVAAARRLVQEPVRQVYSFPLLSDEACEWLVEEVLHYQSTGLPIRRPNSMNNYGLVLNEIGLRPSLTALQKHVHPLAKALFPVEGESFDGHHSFCVSYRPNEDRGLDMHTDDSVRARSSPIFPANNPTSSHTHPLFISVWNNRM